MLEGTNISFSAFDRKRIELAKLGFDGNSEAIKFFGLKKPPWHSEDEIPFDDALETLEYLKRKGLSTYQDPKLGKNYADWVIDDLGELKAIFG